MTIQRDDLQDLDFSDVTAGGDPIAPVTPGEVLRTEFMEPFGLSANALAKALLVPANRITAILNGSRAITADTALRLARYFNTTPQSWINLQSNYELEVARRLAGQAITEQVRPRAA